MKLVIKNSSVLENGTAKPVTVAQMEFGEIALNYNSADPTIFFKDSTNVIRGVRLGIQADITDASNQPGTYDDRYLRSDISSSVSGSITAQNFIGGVSRIGSTPPTASSPGELWYNTSDGRLYIYYQDVDSGQWVDAAPDTYEFAENYYTKSETNSIFAYKSGDTFTGTVNFDGSATNSLVFTTSVNGVVNSSSTANGDHFSLTAGQGTTGDIGYRVLNTGTFESYTPQSSDGNAIKALRVFQGTTENAFITAAGAGTFTSVSGDGSGITALDGAVVKAAYEAELDSNTFTDSDSAKLDGIEVGATADQTGSEIKALYEAEPNAFTDAQFTKLAGIEAGATGDLTANEVRDLVESATNSNTFTDADHSKLNGIEANATADQTGSEIKALYESEPNAYTDAKDAKLAGIEAGATGDLTANEVRDLVESATNSNTFTDADHSKLNGIEANATADQTGAEIKSLYEAQSNTNAFTDTLLTKLNGIASGATNVTLGNYANTGLYTFDGSGNFTATGNVTAFSDINLKENIEVIPNALDKVSEIRGVLYNRKGITDSTRYAGVIAQEVEAVLPEVVVTNEEGIKSVAYGNLVSLLIESVKELKARVEELENNNLN